MQEPIDIEDHPKTRTIKFNKNNINTAASVVNLLVQKQDIEFSLQANDQDIKSLILLFVEQNNLKSALTIFLFLHMDINSSYNDESDQVFILKLREFLKNNAQETLKSSFLFSRLDIFKFAVESGANPNAIFHREDPYLFSAIKINSEIITFYLENYDRVNINISSKEGSALHIAAIENRPDLIDFFIKKEINLNIENEQGQKAVELVREKYPERAKIIEEITNKQEISLMKQHELKQSPHTESELGVISGSTTNSDKTDSYFEENQSNTDSQSQSVSSPELENIGEVKLFSNFVSNYVSNIDTVKYVVDVLVKCGAYDRVKAHLKRWADGQTFETNDLHKAVKNKSLKKITTSLSKGDDINSLDALGNSALHIAVIYYSEKDKEQEKEKSERIIKALIDAGINTKTKNAVSLTASQLDTGAANLIEVQVNIKADQELLNAKKESEKATQEAAQELGKMLLNEENQKKSKKEKSLKDKQLRNNQKEQSRIEREERERKASEDKIAKEKEQQRLSQKQSLEDKQRRIDEQEKIRIAREENLKEVLDKIAREKELQRVEQEELLIKQQLEEQKRLEIEEEMKKQQEELLLKIQAENELREEEQKKKEQGNLEVLLLKVMAQKAKIEEKKLEEQKKIVIQEEQETPQVQLTEAVIDNPVEEISSGLVKLDIKAGKPTVEITVEFEVTKDKLRSELQEKTISGTLKDLKDLMEEGWDLMINYQDSKGYTALHYAVFNGDPDKVNLLLKHGADKNLCDNEARLTPRDYALQLAYENQELYSSIIKTLTSNTYEVVDKYTHNFLIEFQPIVSSDDYCEISDLSETKDQSFIQLLPVSEVKTVFKGFMPFPGTNSFIGGYDSQNYIIVPTFKGMKYLLNSYITNENNNNEKFNSNIGNNYFGAAYFVKETIQSINLISSVLKIYDLDISFVASSKALYYVHLAASYVGSVALGILNPFLAVLSTDSYQVMKESRNSLVREYQNSDDKEINDLPEYVKNCHGYIIDQTILASIPFVTSPYLAIASINSGISAGLECYLLYNKPKSENVAKENNFEKALKFIAYPMYFLNSLGNLDFSDNYGYINSAAKLKSSLLAVAITDQFFKLPQVQYLIDYAFSISGEIDSLHEESL